MWALKREEEIRSGRIATVSPRTTVGKLLSDYAKKVSPTKKGARGAQIDSLWRKYRDRAGVDGLRFHDLRHLAVTRLSKKLDILALARMIGHRNIK